jgi:hypothetical protein
MFYQERGAESLSSLSSLHLALNSIKVDQLDK